MEKHIAYCDSYDWVGKEMKCMCDDEEDLIHDPDFLNLLLLYICSRLYEEV